MENNFIEIVQIIKQSRTNAIKAVNAELINLYWNVGRYISNKLNHADWGDKTVTELSAYIQRNNPELKGFNSRGLYRMIQFYESYPENHKLIMSSSNSLSSENQESAIVSSLMTQFKAIDIKESIIVRISWTHHMTIFSRCKLMEEREFYIKLSIRESYSVRELDRQISSSLFERAMTSENSKSVIQSNSKTDIEQVFKDSYVFDFLNLPEKHSEGDLQNGLLNRMKDFILELGRDFIFIGNEYKLMVGDSDFYIDLLFYHRGLQCLVAFELKAGKFKPEHIGQLNFYLEALDRDVKKEHENPSIGILLCKDKNNQVVEYSLSRSLSPTMVAKYRTQLPEKELLQQKFNDIFEEEKPDSNQD
ncbi:PDDEXK nuclease domain-containing protein [Flavobacterium psychrotrophum]|uniref:PDDEXK nuclease domain-containing protein n=1 Tax=Flavobacterium psychrotrophum TaxID=2294119 RepID=UPI000E315D81|nr:PDDEXK nuclease domain-containing protein [Flavobacterium psychrotrophum]